MIIVDLIIAAPIAYFAFRGALNGLVKEILNIVGIVLAVFLTFQYMDALSVILVPFFQEEQSAYIPFLSAILIFIGTLILIALISFLTKKLLEATNLSTVNRIFGSLFGALKSGMAVSTLLILLSGFNIPNQETRDQSYLYGYVLHIAPWTFNAVAVIYPGAENYTDTLKETLSNYNPVDHLPLINDK
ncbi:MAG: CvpA family protein [Bacteroidota bacterium]